MELQGKAALVTGGAAGIGLECVTQLLEAGVKGVAILDVSEAAGRTAVTSLESRFGAGRAVFFQTDVTNDDQLKEAFQKTKDTFSGLDIVINNAGVPDYKGWELVIATNFTSVVRGTMLAMEMMDGGRGGAVLNMASIFGLTPIAGSPLYAATKHGVVGLTRSFGMPFHTRDAGVRVMALCPGVTQTAMAAEALSMLSSGVMSEALRELALRPTQQTDAVARAAVEMLRHAPSGSVWVVEGGQAPYPVRALSLDEQRSSDKPANV